MPVVNVNGTEIHYEEWGSGPPILCIHGTGIYGALWEWSMRPLGDTHRVIAYDRRGFGASGGPRGRRLADHVADAAALMRKLDAAPAAVVALSGGGTIALGLAAGHPDLVDKLVLAEPAYRIGQVPSVTVLRAIVGLNYRWLLRRDLRGGVEIFLRWASRYESGGNGFDPLPEEWRRVALEQSAAATAREVWQDALPWPPARRVRAISCPVTLVVADNGDPAFRQTTSWVHRLLPRAKLVEIAGAGHLIPTDKPDEFGAVVREALESTAPVPATAGR